MKEGTPNHDYPWRATNRREFIDTSSYDSCVFNGSVHPVLVHIGTANFVEKRCKYPLCDYIKVG